MAKTDLEIVTEVNDLARIMLRFLNTGYEAPAGHKFWKAPDPRSQTAWARAVVIYEEITRSEVHDALQALNDDDIDDDDLADAPVDDVTTLRSALEKAEHWLTEEAESPEPGSTKPHEILRVIRKALGRTTAR